jgi:hypothetical protein
MMEDACTPRADLKSRLVHFPATIGGMLDDTTRRRSLLTTALVGALLPAEVSEGRMVCAWLDTWQGIGDVVTDEAPGVRCPLVRVGVRVAGRVPPLAGEPDAEMDRSGCSARALARSPVRGHRHGAQDLGGLACVANGCLDAVPTTKPS